MFGNNVFRGGELPLSPALLPSLRDSDEVVSGEREGERERGEREREAGRQRTQTRKLKYSRIVALG